MAEGDSRFAEELNSRLSPETVVAEAELMLIAPRLNDDELVFMLKLHELEKGVEAGLQDLNHALLHNDVEAGIRGARRFSSLGVLMDEAQKKVTRS